MKVTVQYTTAESLSLAKTQKWTGTLLEHFFNMFKKGATENKLSDTPGNIFNFDECGKQINKKNLTL